MHALLVSKGRDVRLYERGDEDGPNDLHGLIEASESTELAKSICSVEAISGEGHDRAIERLEPELVLGTLVSKFPSSKCQK